jgi:thiosulfate dehydrogenase [quinone] large subunit
VATVYDGPEVTRDEGCAMLDRLVHPPMRPEQFQEPRWARFLFASTDAAWLWLVVRLYVASIFLPAGWAKITSGKWLFGDGSPIQGLVGSASQSPDTPGWYSWFLQHVVIPNAGLFATLVSLGETAVGLGLLVGLLTGIAAFGGVFLNANFVLAGALGQNPALIVLGTLLALAWRNAGWIGLDRWFMPWIHREVFAERAGGEAPPPTAAMTT